jgi:hypothetical protein
MAGSATLPNGLTCSVGTVPSVSCRVETAFLHQLTIQPAPLDSTSSRSPAVASNTSKTARASVRAGQSTGGALSVLGEYKYLIPLANGRFAYVRNLTNGKTAHLRTDADAFVEEIRVLATAGHAAKIRAELQTLDSSFPNDGWAATEKRLADAGIFEG